MASIIVDGPLKGTKVGMNIYDLYIGPYELNIGPNKRFHVFKRNSDKNYAFHQSFDTDANAKTFVRENQRNMGSFD